MTGLLTPGRRRGIEILDDPLVDPDVMRRSMEDVERANNFFGGRRAAIEELKLVLPAMRSPVSILDVGTGRGDIPSAAVAVARAMGIELHTIGLDISAPLVAGGASRIESVVRGDALHLPFADESVDIVLASQILHHFQADQAAAFVRELHRVAKRAVVISDLRRSRLAAAGLWLGSFPLGFHPVSRHDGVVSVMRGFVPSELSSLVESATGTRPRVRRRLGFRLTTNWIKHQSE